jgi:hypothetical protein
MILKQSHDGTTQGFEDYEIKVRNRLFSLNDAEDTWNLEY